MAVTVDGSVLTIDPGLVLTTAEVVRPEWRQKLPVLQGHGVTLRGLEESDARSLFAALATPEVAAFMPPPPDGVRGFRRFIEWAHREQAEGRGMCFGVVPSGSRRPIGVFQIRRLESGFETAMWGFALSSSYWGSGLFIESAEQVLGFAFGTLGVRRLEGRTAVTNARGNRALEKLGAVMEAVLARSLRHGHEYLDQALWTIFADTWNDPQIGVLDKVA